MAPAKTLNKCKNNEFYSYTGKENSPLGLGYSAETMRVGEIMTGRDKFQYVVGIKQGARIWMRLPAGAVDVNMLAKEPQPIQAKTEKKAKANEPEAEPEPKAKAEEPEAEADEPEPEPKAEPKTDDKAEEKPKKKKAVKKTAKTDEADKTEAEPKPKQKRPPNAYNIFVRETIARIKANSETPLTGKDLMRLASEEWNALKASKK